MKRTIAISFLSLALPLAVFAGTSVKYTFNNVVLTDSTIIEIEATVKDTAKSKNSRCDYWSDDYISWLGYYQVPSVAGSDAATVQAFCVNHFGDKIQ